MCESILMGLTVTRARRSVGAGGGGTAKCGARAHKEAAEACLPVDGVPARSSAAQGGLDGGAQLSVERRGLGREGADDLPVLAHQVLVEVPLGLAVLGGEELVDGGFVLALGLHLGELGEGD